SAMMVMFGVNWVIQSGASSDRRCNGDERGSEIRSRDQQHEQASDQTHKLRLRPPAACIKVAPVQIVQSSTVRRRSAFPMTVTELNAIAALAIIGFSSSPKAG